MYMVDEERCNGCGSCESICPMDAVRMENAVPVIDQQRCNECGACFDACTQGAIYEMREPARTAASSQTVATAADVPVPEAYERSLGPRTSSGIAGTGIFTAAFPVVLKLAGAVADYVSARAGQRSNASSGPLAGKGCGRAGGRGGHRHGRG